MLRLRAVREHVPNASDKAGQEKKVYETVDGKP